MPIYQYVALSKRGEKKKNLLLVDSKQDVVEELNRMGYYSISIHQIDNVPKIKKLSKEKIYFFTRELYQLLKAKISIYDSLQNIQKKNTDPSLQILLIGLMDKIRQGSQFSSSIALYKDIFDPVYISILQAGDESGKMEQAVLYLKVMIDKEIKMEKKIRSQLAYPKFLASVSLLLILAVLVFLVPSFQDLIDVAGQKGITRIVFQASFILRTYPLVILGVIIGIISSCFFLFKTEKFRNFWLNLQINFRPFSSFYLPKIYSRFFLVLAFLLESSLPLVEALNIAKKTVNHDLIEKELDKFIKDMKEGKSLTQALKYSRYIPEMVFQIVLSREEIGAYKEAFYTIQEIYEDELERNLQQLATYIQPMLFLLLGLVIGMIILSVMIPLSDAANFKM